MSSGRVLKDLLIESAARTPEALAVVGPDGSITYGELDALANQMARALAERGVGRGDRVGIWLEKSVGTVAAMQGALRLGAAYVPLDPMAPAARTGTIIRDCAMRVLVTNPARAATVLTGDLAEQPTLCVDGPWHAEGWAEVKRYADKPLPDPGVTQNDLAYILYTSGSTGQPKGVCVSSLNALAFVEWAAENVQATANDRLSNHAPFHFDLSVFDLYAAFHVGASVHIVPDGLSFAPKKLVNFIAREQITVWYSVPSVLILMMDEGGLLDAPDLPLRVVIFAGEPFPIKKLRQLFEGIRRPRYLNYYGPTETNVCTYWEVLEIEPERIKPVPIGQASSFDKVWAVKEDGTTAGPGEEGELMCDGPTVMLGYWGREPQGGKPYNTGDVVRVMDDGINYEYIGRRDHMVKVRGNRVELGDIEAVLAQHPAVSEVAVTVAGSGIEARLVAFVSSPASSPPALLELKRHCAERLPRYMIIHDVQYLNALPRTRNGKVDRLQLAQVATQAPVSSRQ